MLLFGRIHNDKQPPSNRVLIRSDKTDIPIWGGRLLRFFLPILCLLVFLAPAQAQATNVRVNPITGEVTWTGVPGQSRYDVLLYNVALNRISNGFVFPRRPQRESALHESNHTERR